MTAPGLPERLAQLRSEIVDSARRAGRGPGSVSLLAVTKGRPPELLREALGSGLQELGENYIQECSAKQSWLLREGLDRVSWHLLGHLQRNKAKRAAQLFSRISSLDSLGLARILSKAREGEPAIQVLCELELTGLPGRSGFRPAELERDWEELRELPGITVQGLMTVAAPGGGRAVFSACRELAERLSQVGGSPLPVLSMGMSQDFREAIEEGSTEVRIGSQLFGPRPASVGNALRPGDSPPTG